MSQSTLGTTLFLTEAYSRDATPRMELPSIGFKNLLHRSCSDVTISAQDLRNKSPHLVTSKSSAHMKGKGTVAPTHIMKAYLGSGGLAPIILT
jgi:hypothetical protein